MVKEKPTQDTVNYFLVRLAHFQQLSNDVFAQYFPIPNTRFVEERVNCLGDSSRVFG